MWLRAWSTEVMPVDRDMMMMMIVMMMMMMMMMMIMLAYSDPAHDILYLSNLNDPIHVSTYAQDC